MKVYALCYVDIEQFDVLGVFDSEEKAELAKKRVKCGDIFFKVYEMEVNKLIKNKNAYYVTIIDEK